MEDPYWAEYRAHLKEHSRVLFERVPPTLLSQDAEYAAGPSKADIDRLANEYAMLADE